MLIAQNAQQGNEKALFTERMEALESRINRRFEDWEHRFERIAPSTGSRIAMLQAGHAQLTGFRFGSAQDKPLLRPLEDATRH